MRPEVRDIVLDLGGPSHDNGRLAGRFSKIIVLNVDIRAFGEELSRAKHALPQYCFAVGDGCALPLGNRSVDFVFCDQVIEHVPKNRRLVFVEEIARVARRGYLLSTPNYYFPFEPHYMVPLMQYCPESVKRKLVSRVRLGWMDASTYHEIDLLTRREIAALLPEAVVEGLSFGPWPAETLIAWSRFPHWD